MGGREEHQAEPGVVWTVANTSVRGQLRPELRPLGLWVTLRNAWRHERLIAKDSRSMRVASDYAFMRPSGPVQTPSSPRRGATGVPVTQATRAGLAGRQTWTVGLGHIRKNVAHRVVGPAGTTLIEARVNHPRVLGQQKTRPTRSRVDMTTL